MTRKKRQELDATMVGGGYQGIPATIAPLFTFSRQQISPLHSLFGSAPVNARNDANVAQQSSISRSANNCSALNQSWLRFGSSATQDSNPFSTALYGEVKMSVIGLFYSRPSLTTEHLAP